MTVSKTCGQYSIAFLHRSAITDTMQVSWQMIHDEGNGGRE